MHKEQIKHMLQQGSLTASELKDRLRVSQPTLSRRVKNVTGLIRIGETHQSKYALQSAIPELGEEQGLYSIDEHGQIRPFGVLKFLAANQSAMVPPGSIFNGLFPPLYDMMPEGYMGRAFAQRHGNDLGFPNQLRDWTDQQKLIAIAKKGEDWTGNLILGRESAERWQKLSTTETALDDLPSLANEAMAGYPSGSFAGGEQPKFSIFSDNKHYLVKFVTKDKTQASDRWVELLRCEHEALNILNENGISAAQTTLIESDDFFFLLSERFDRIGTRGRRPLTSLSVVGNHFYGNLQRWSITAEKLFREGRLNKVDLMNIKRIEAFSMLIGDSDRHFHNLSLVPDSSFEKFSLAPAYDKLPMYFAPRNGQVIESDYHPPLAEANLMEVWDDAESMATHFWQRTAPFRRFGRQRAIEQKKTAPQPLFDHDISIEML